MRIPSLEWFLVRITMAYDPDDTLIAARSQQLRRAKMEIDLHGYHPAEIVFNGVLSKILQQVWEMGESDVTLIMPMVAIGASHRDL